MTSSIGSAGSCQSTSGMQAWNSTQRSAQKGDPSALIDGLFAKIDTKNQGYIDKSELQSAFASLSTNATAGSDGDAASLFSKLDGDGDGKVTKNELSDGLQALASQLLSQLHQSGHRPRPAGDDQGLTKDQLTAGASTPSAGQQLDSQTLVQWLKLLQIYASNSLPQNPATDATSLSVSA